MQDNFALALARVLVHEGGRSDNPKDPGGRTFEGVTQNVYNAYRSRHGLPSQDVFYMDAAERNSIYRGQFWDAIKGDSLPIGLDYVVFDGAVNSGSVQAVKWLQRALGVQADGHIGGITLNALEQTADVDRLIAAVCERRLLFCKALNTWRTFGKGWSARIAQVQKYGQAQAVGSVGPDPVYVAGANRKAVLSDAKKAPQTILADASAGGGVSATSVVAWVKEQTSEFMGISDFTDRVLSGVMILAALVAILAGAYALYARKRAAVLADRLDTRPMQLAASTAIAEEPEAAAHA